MRKTFPVIVAAVLAVCGAVCCFGGARAIGASVSAQEEADPAERYKELRERLRSAEKAQLNDIAHNAADEELARMAQEQLILLCLRDEQESTCEAILEMRGFVSPIVTVHTESANVILKAETLTAQESAVIFELVCRETGLCADNVKIVPIK